MRAIEELNHNEWTLELCEIEAEDLPDYEELRDAVERTRSELKGYAVIDLKAIWESEILPLIDEHKYLQDAHTSCMRDFIDYHSYTDQRHMADTYTEAQDGGAWVFTPSDYWDTTIDEDIEEAADDGNEEAQILYRLRDSWYFLSENKLIPDDIKTRVSNLLSEIKPKFEPQRHEPHYWVPMHSCHWASTWGYYLAKAWRPDGQWKIRSGPGHTTVVDTKNKQVFDVLLYDKSVDHIRKQLQEPVRP
ncbi:MAG: hypothetical protein AB7S74_17470 [Hyphomicrobium sp.]